MTNPTFSSTVIQKGKKGYHYELTRQSKTILRILHLQKRTGRENSKSIPNRFDPNISTVYVTPQLSKYFSLQVPEFMRSPTFGQKI